MNKEIKQKWVKALRSGKYKQTRSKLKSTNGRFCCLGVLCDIYAKENGLRCSRHNDVAMGIFDSLELLPDEIKDWADVDNDPILYLKEGTKTLTCLNDEDGKSFKEIADLIEENL